MATALPCGRRTTHEDVSSVCHRDGTGEVVIAGAGGALGAALVALPQRADRTGRRECRQTLDDVGHALVGETVVAVAAMALDGDQAGEREPSEMRARGRR
jgi:hypothetical protein